MVHPITNVLRPQVQAGAAVLEDINTASLGAAAVPHQIVKKSVERNTLGLLLVQLVRSFQASAPTFTPCLYHHMNWAWGSKGSLDCLIIY